MRFSVHDTGIGIAGEHLPALFEPFTQGEVSTSRRYGGTGLGLTISKRLVELMGGRLEVSSVVDWGSTFQFTVPLQEVDVAGDAGSSEVEDLPRIRLQRDLGRTAPLRILVAEDNRVNQKVLLRILERMGYRADLAADGLEVLEAVRRQPYDLILMDVRMPELDGVEATRRIRSEPDLQTQPRIVALTAGVMQEDRGRCLEAGMDDYVDKPVRPHDLQAVLLHAAGRLAHRQPVRARTSGTTTREDSIAEVLRDLELVADADTVAEVVSTFLETVGLQIRALREALAAGDLEAVSRAAHTLRGGGGTIGALRLAETVSRLEACCRRGDLEEAQELLASVETETDRVCAVLRGSGATGAPATPGVP